MDYPKAAKGCEVVRDISGVELALNEHPFEIMKRQQKGIRRSVTREGEDHVTVCGSRFHFVSRSAVEGQLRVERRCIREVLVAREQERALGEDHGEVQVLRERAGGVYEFPLDLDAERSEAVECGNAAGSTEAATPLTEHEPSARPSARIRDSARLTVGRSLPTKAPRSPPVSQERRDAPFPTSARSARAQRARAQPHLENDNGGPPAGRRSIAALANAL